jgi:protein O-mannosyl-transferase
MQTRHDRHLPALASLSLVAITLAVYWQVQGHDFLIWDDFAYIVENPHVRSGLSVENVLWAFTTTHASYWHPLTWLSHMLDCELYGLNPQGHHFNALLLHTASTLMLFLVLRGMTGALWRSACVAALFSLHPLRIESVAWAAERKDLLGGLFWMLTLWAYLRYVRRPETKNYLVILLSFSLGLMAKPTVVTLPFALLLLDYWPLGRFPWGPPPADKSLWACWEPRSSARLLVEKLPLFILTGISSLATYVVVRRAGDVPGLDSIPLDLRIGNSLVSYVKYMEKTIWPMDLACLYPHPMDALSFWLVAGSFILLGGISLLVFFHAKRHPYLPVGWLWYLGTLIPVIGLVHVGAQGMADRFTYLPHMGLFLAAVWGVGDLTLKWPYRNAFLYSGSCVILFLFALSTHDQLRHWKDSTSLFSRAIEVTRNNFLAQYFLGNALARENRPAEAAIHFAESLRMNPHNYSALYNLAFIMAREGRLEEATFYYSEALRLNPSDATIHNNLGNLWVRRRNPDRAVRHFLEALKIHPDYATAHNNLANVLIEQGRLQEAIHHYSEALRIQPGFAETRYNLERALQKPEKGMHNNRSGGVLDAPMKSHPGYPDPLAGTAGASGTLIGAGGNE